MKRKLSGSDDVADVPSKNGAKCELNSEFEESLFEEVSDNEGEAALNQLQWTQGFQGAKVKIHEESKDKLQSLKIWAPLMNQAGEFAISKQTCDHII